MTTTTEEMEQPAKQWQMAAVQTELKGVNEKLDTLIEAARGYAAHADVEMAAKESRAYTDQKVKELKAVTEAKYDPFVKLTWALITAICIAIATSVVAIKRS